MSSEAIGHVFRHAPYDGATFSLLLAIADSANDQNDNEIWMMATTMADKARVNNHTAGKVIKQLVKDGWLEVLVPSEKGKTGRYRLILDRDRPVVFEYSKKKKNVTQVHSKSSKKNAPEAEQNALFDTGECTSGPEECTPGANIEPKGTQRKTQENQSSAKASLSIHEEGVLEAEVMTPGKTAKKLLDEHYEQMKAQGEEPVWNFKGVMQIVIEFLEKGRNPEAIRYALSHHAYTKNGMNFLIEQFTKGGTKTQKTKKHNQQIASQVREMGVDVDAIRAEMGF